MFETWTDFDRTFRMMDDLRRHMDTSFPWQPALARGLAGRLGTVGAPRGPIVNWHETDEAFFLVAELPGVAKDAVELSIEADQLRLAVTRKTEPPKDYETIMEERSDWAFAQTFALPARIDVERVEARLENGVLEIELPKHPEAKPRQIAIQAR